MRKMAQFVPEKLNFESSPSIGVSLNFLTLGIELGTELSSFELEFPSLGPMDVSIVLIGLNRVRSISQLQLYFELFSSWYKPKFKHIL